MGTLIALGVTFGLIVLAVLVFASGQMPCIVCMVK